MRFLQFAAAAASAAVVTAGVCTAVQAQSGSTVRVIAANPQGSVFYSASATLGKVLADKLKMQVRVQPMGGSSTYIPLLNRGEVDFGLTNVDDAVKSFNGKGGFSRPNPDLRLMAASFYLTFGILVPGNSPVQKVEDLKGLKIASGYKSQVTGAVLQDAALATGGLTMKDLRGVPTPSLFSGTDMLGDGKVDAASLAVGAAQVASANISLKSRGGVRFLDLDDSPKSLAAVRKFLPARFVTVQPGGNRAGIVKPTKLIGYTVFFSTHAKMADDVVYALVKMLRDSKAELVKGTPVFAGFDPARMTEETGVPWHPGAIRFYKEIGQWPPKG